MRKIIDPSRERDTIWIFISQVGMEMDQMKQRLGNKYTISGGKKFMHFVDVIMLFEQGQGKINKIYDENRIGLDDKPIQIGNVITMKVLGKSRCGPPNKTAIFKFLYDKGIIDQWEEIAKIAMTESIVVKEGKTYFYNSAKLGVGEETYFEMVKNDEKLQKELFNAIMEKIKYELPSDRGSASEVVES
jgi:hypothetical protein